MHFPPLLTSLTLLTTAIAAPSSLRRQSSGWTIRNFTRDCPTIGGTRVDGCTYVLTIDTSDASQECTIKDMDPYAYAHAWYNLPCSEDPDYHLSWGWNYSNDFTVMTVVYEPAQLEAFFGYSNPNFHLPSTSYPDVGPNPVQSTGA